VTDLKSLAHPNWPYAGTAHEWRGFVKSSKGKIVLLDEPTTVQFDWQTGVYQKQNFGPELK
jgi:hypothetical protein